MKTGMTSIRKKSWLLNIARWFDSYAGNEAEMTSTQFNWVRVIPFLLLHLACFAALWTGVSTVALATCLGLFWLTDVCDYGVLPPLLRASQVNQPMWAPPEATLYG